MNDRILELSFEAQRYALDNTTGPDLASLNELWQEKFAELLIQECARIIINGGYWTDILGNRKNASPDEIAQMIKEHFGVEE